MKISSFILHPFSTPSPSNLSLSPFLFTLSSFPLARLRCAPYANGVIYISKW